MCEAKFEVRGATTVDAIAAKALYDRGVPFIDVQNRSRWDNDGHVNGAVWLGTTSPRESDLSAIADKGAELVFYCTGFT